MDDEIEPDEEEVEDTLETLREAIEDLRRTYGREACREVGREFRALVEEIESIRGREHAEEGGRRISFQEAIEEACGRVVARRGKGEPDPQGMAAVEYEVAKLRAEAGAAPPSSQVRISPEKAGELAEGGEEPFRGI